MINSILIYDCKEGFARVSGQNFVKCVDVDGEGVWTGDLLTCKKSITSGILSKMNCVLVLAFYKCKTFPSLLLTIIITLLKY